MSEWTPALSAAVFNTAEPAATGELPSDVGPSKNSTEPVGVPEPGGLTVTVAVSATLEPNVDGFGEEFNAVAVPAWFTVCPCAGDVLPVKLALPE